MVDEAEGADRADETDVTDMAEIALHINALFYLDCLGHKELKTSQELRMLSRSLCVF